MLSVCTCLLLTSQFLNHSLLNFVYISWHLSQSHQAYFINPCSKSKPKLITTKGQSAGLAWCQAPISDPRSIPPHPSSIILDLQIYWCGAPSLTRSRVCSFQCLLDMASAGFLSPKGLISLFFVLCFWDPPNLGPGSCIYFPQEQGNLALGPPTIFVSVCIPHFFAGQQ
jgi:hypothetical protein